jgi:sugar phosphate isomerase/epimerase
MKTIKGPAILLAQFAGDAAPFNTLDSIATWVAEVGCRGVQIPSWDERLFDIRKAAESKTYCDTLHDALRNCNIELTELSAHLQGQRVAVHPA